MRSLLLALSLLAWPAWAEQPLTDAGPWPGNWARPRRRASGRFPPRKVSTSGAGS